MMNAEEIRAWMLAVLAETGLTARQWAQAAGVAPSTIQRAIKPDYQFVTSSRTLAKLAAVAKVELPFANTPRGRIGRTIPLFLPVRHKVRAGLWLEVDQLADESYGEKPVTPDPRYSNFPQWLELVEGDSCDLRIVEGGYARVVDAIELGYTPADGDLVVVERRRDQGGLRERTIKQVRISSAGAELVGCSRNTKWNTPLDLNGHADAEVEIVGKVIGAYYDF